jgi:hypothetical protein
MRELKPLVFKCPYTGIDVITSIGIREGEEARIAHGVFAFSCPCCNELHHLFGYESRNVQRFQARRLHAS